MRGVGWIEKVGIQHRIVLDSGQRNSRLGEMLTKMMKRGLEIVNCLWHGGIFEHTLQAAGQCLIIEVEIEIDHRSGAWGIRNCDSVQAWGASIFYALTSRASM